MVSDLTVKDQAGRPVVAVEVKARPGVNSTWAAQYHRNLLAHTGSAPSDFFLLVTPEHAFLWREVSVSSLTERQPDVVFETRELLGERLRELEGTHGRIAGAALAHVVAAWLSAIVSASSLDQLPKETRSFAQVSGLYNAAQGGSVQFEAA